MTAQFTVLASGSGGNSSLLELDGFGLMIDCGLRPQELAERLAVVRRSWKSVSAVLVTHTHRDHWNPYTVEHLRRLNVPLIAHPSHHAIMARNPSYAPLRRANLTRDYAEGEAFDITPALGCLPVRVPHDSNPTFAFRFDARDGLFGPAWSLGFASDVGHVTRTLAATFAGVDVLAVEFNHDEAMQRASGRPAILINRVLGKDGHLSNEQAADLTRFVAKSGGLRHVVQLHLSRDCNRPDLAASAGRAALAEFAPEAEVVTASQFTPTAPLSLVPRPAARRRPVRLPAPRRVSRQPTLPGLGDEPAPAR
jgi:phosphoribosyl 1,2-cyclic phosphodiesterase